MHHKETLSLFSPQNPQWLLLNGHWSELSADPSKSAMSGWKQAAFNPERIPRLCDKSLLTVCKDHREYRNQVKDTFTTRPAPTPPLSLQEDENEKIKLSRVEELHENQGILKKKQNKQTSICVCLSERILQPCGHQSLSTVFLLLHCYWPAASNQRWPLRMMSRHASVSHTVSPSDYLTLLFLLWSLQTWVETCSSKSLGCSASASVFLHNKATVCVKVTKWPKLNVPKT